LREVNIYRLPCSLFAINIEKQRHLGTHEMGYLR
jgi:hypothetical protein